MNIGMTLERLVQHITVKQIYGKPDINIEGIDSDSRNIKDKYLFIAVKGTSDMNLSIRQ